MIKNWINRAIALLEHSLQPMPNELNELDWKETLSPNNEKLTRHLSAFANLPGGGFMVFGVEDSTGKLNGITQKEASTIIEKLSNLGRDAVSPVINRILIDLKPAAAKKGACFLFAWKTAATPNSLVLSCFLLALETEVITK